VALARGWKSPFPAPRRAGPHEKVDPAIDVDAMAYDPNEPDIVSRLEQFGPRLRMIINDSPGSLTEDDSAETQSA
jgi:hypothetical protein